MAICLDASVVVAALLPRPPSPAASRFLKDRVDERERLVAPPLLLAETTSVLRRHVHLGAIQHGEAIAALQDILALPIEILGPPRLYLMSLELAQRLGHARAYDVQYLAVAEYQGCPVVTLDQGLYESARTLGIAARLLV